MARSLARELAALLRRSARRVVSHLAVALAPSAARGYRWPPNGPFARWRARCAPPSLRSPPRGTASHAVPAFVRRETLSGRSRRRRRRSNTAAPRRRASSTRSRVGRALGRSPRARVAGGGLATAAQD